MSNPAKPVWPAPGALPFSLFGSPESAPSSPQSGAQAFAQPFAQGLAGGMDFMKKLWGNVPGNTAVPSFLLPTLDLDELDKRISDLKAAESWLEVNLNLLRATVQGLEVQRNTIAAIRSLGVPIQAPQTGSTAPPTPSGLPPGWPVANEGEGATRAGTRAPQPVDRAANAAPMHAHPAETVSEEPRSHADQDQASAPRASAPRKAAHKSSRSSAPAPAAPDVSIESAPVSPLAGLTANNWLGYMQDQFAKVAQAALASSSSTSANNANGKPAAAAPRAPPKAASKTAAKRRPAAKKKRTSR